MGKRGSTGEREKTPGRNGSAAGETGERTRRVQAGLREGPGSAGKERAREAGGGKCLANTQVFTKLQCFLLM